MAAKKDIRTRIIKALKKQKTYTPELEICVDMTAAAYSAMEKAVSDISDLENTYVEEKSREGNVKLVPHPAFKVLKDTAEQVRKSLRELGLTLTTLSADAEDPLEELDNVVNKY